MMKKINAFFMMIFVTGCSAMGTKDHETGFELPNVNKSPTLSRSRDEAISVAILQQQRAMSKKYLEANREAEQKLKEFTQLDHEETWCTLF